MEHRLIQKAPKSMGLDMTGANQTSEASYLQYSVPKMAVEDNLDFLSKLNSEVVQLVITSPPYNIGKSYERQKPLDDYLAFQEKVILECVRILKPTGSICWQVGNYVHKGEVIPLDTLIYPMFARLGLKMRNLIIWHFEHGLHCRKRFSGRYETINWFTKSSDYTFNLNPVRVPSKYPNKKHFKGPNKGRLSGNPMGKNPSDLWIFPNVKSNHVEKTVHPCQFPVELVERLVLSLSNEGDTVFDPYLGIGSTAIGAIIHHRQAIGCDISPEYIDIAWQRYRSLIQGDLKLRPMNKPVYNPSLPNGGQD